MQKEEKITVLYQLVSQIIDEYQLPDEADIRKILEEKVKKKEEEDSKICLASVIEKELVCAIKSGQICEANAGLYQCVFEESIKNSEIGNMPAEDLSDILIKKFVLQVGKTYGINRTKIKCFTGMLQTGLNKMSEDDMLDFVPNKHVYKNYLMYSDREIHYIDNPYTDDETEKIKEWIDLHPNDTRGLAIGLWFCGETSLEEIANLKKEDCHISIFKKWERAQIISRALNLHPKNEKFVFMEIKEKRLEKLTPQGFQLKLYHICNKLGIKYKRINRTEAMLCKE